MNSILLIDKPAGRTSSHTLNELKKILKIKKIGHSGTLDKFASGLLVVCTGWTTKLAGYFLEGDKRYVGTIRLGIVTDTLDSEGKVVEVNNIASLNPELINNIPSKFTGEISQLPPLFSALKINGKRASDYMRSGEKIELKERKIYIKNLSIVKIDLDNFRVTLDVTCSKGTYIRSLARDIGTYLGTGAHLESLRRIASGNFSIENAATLEEIKISANLNNLNIADKKFLLCPEESLPDLSSVTIKKNAEKKILNGVFFVKDDIISLDYKGSSRFIILNEEKNLIAIADIDIDNWIIKYLNVFNKI